MIGSSTSTNKSCEASSEEEERMQNPPSSPTNLDARVSSKFSCAAVRLLLGKIVSDVSSAGRLLVTASLTNKVASEWSIACECFDQPNRHNVPPFAGVALNPVVLIHGCSILDQGIALQGLVLGRRRSQQSSRLLDTPGTPRLQGPSNCVLCPVRSSPDLRSAPEGAKIASEKERPRCIRLFGLAVNPGGGPKRCPA